MKLSGCILVKNNARSIRYAVESIYKHVDELVIIDSGSTDGTLDIVSEYTDRIFFNEFKDFATQRNFATTKCRGEWICMLDADEVVGKRFPDLRNYLDCGYQSIYLPRYHVLTLDPVRFITTKPHYLNWQGRMFRNNGKSYFYDPVHHKLGDYRPRLKCAITHFFHFDFMFNSYESRLAKVNYYEKYEKGSGYPTCYLFEDYQYSTAQVIEEMEVRILEMLKADKSLISYPTSSNAFRQLHESNLYFLRSAITKGRSRFGI